MKQLVKQIRKQYSRKKETRGFCKCKNTLFIGDNGLRCVLCKKLEELTIIG